ncbi:tetrahydrodipicolinate N-succinyltransferase N-terminal domain-containing protein, partial [uncultured Campylobacter sp.]|uniref:tetrahydrodipicolinate N-succinyltransferase N-terminal domain-containing protein n=1 Tax=uncultured Campylobacter sp. TaxID=218934 RepID=UPI00261A3A9C
MKEIKSLSELRAFADKIRAEKGYRDPMMWAIGRVFKGRAKEHKSLSVNYAHVNFKDGLVS